jgi:hypothetical protein
LIARVWFSRDGAEKGLPWHVKVDDGPTELCDNFMFVGFARPVFVTEGAKLPDGPRGYIEIEVPAAPTTLAGRVTGWLARKAGWWI